MVYNKANAVYGDYREIIAECLAARSFPNDEYADYTAECVENYFLNHVFASGCDVEDGRVYACDGVPVPNFNQIMLKCLIQATGPFYHIYVPATNTYYSPISVRSKSIKCSELVLGDDGFFCGNSKTRVFTFRELSALNIEPRPLAKLIEAARHNGLNKQEV